MTDTSESQEIGIDETPFFDGEVMIKDVDDKIIKVPKLGWKREAEALKQLGKIIKAAPDVLTRIDAIDFSKAVHPSAMASVIVDLLQMDMDAVTKLVGYLLDIKPSAVQERLRSDIIIWDILIPFFVDLGRIHGSKMQASMMGIMEESGEGSSGDSPPPSTSSPVSTAGQSNT